MARNWFKDGQLDTEALDELESSLKKVTDRTGGIIDQMNKKGFVPAFRCGHSRLYLPGDYLNGWGTLYGIGLGPDPVSEVLDSDYEAAPPDITPDIRRIEQIMHPLRSSMAQVDFLLVDPAEFKDQAAILDYEDEGMEERARIVRAKQLINPRGRLRVMQAKWEGK